MIAESLKRIRRTWSPEEKMAILQEAADSGFSSVARKYNIKTSLLFEWRKRSRNGSSASITDAGNEQVDLQSLLSEIQKLDKIHQCLASKLQTDLDKGQITSYNASCALGNLHNSLSKLENLQSQVTQKMIVLEKNQQSETDITNSVADIPSELRRLAEMLLVAKEKHGVNLQTLFKYFDDFLTQLGELVHV